MVDAMDELGRKVRSNFLCRARSRLAGEAGERTMGGGKQRVGLTSHRYH